MLNLNGELMSGDRAIAVIRNGLLQDCDDARLPYYLKRTQDLQGWLELRAVDRHRPNSRLLRRLYRLGDAEDAEIALRASAVTITDNFWIRREGSSETYEDVRFKENLFADVALEGKLDAFSDGRWRHPSSSPELTNVGSFEKCWRFENGAWWMYKRGDESEQFAELFIAAVTEQLGYAGTAYYLTSTGVKSKDFTENGRYNFDPAVGFIGDRYDDYVYCYEKLQAFGQHFADDYVKLLYVDAICRNVDRHSGNFGILRDPDTGEAVRLAPNYDNNIALFARLSGTASISAKKDMLITDFLDLIEQKDIAFELPQLSRRTLSELAESVPVKDASGMAVDFVYSRQNMIAEELEKIRAQNLPKREIRETEKRLAGLNRKMQDTTSVWEKLELGQQMQAEQKRLEGLKRQNAPERGKLKHSSREK